MAKLGTGFPSRDVDVAVIGAGAAGIAAGRRLAEAGVNFVLLEARSRVGGRAWTKTARGFPLDLGCGWLHSGDRNPWTQIAEHSGFTIDRTPAPWTADKHDQSFTEDEYRDYRAAAAAFYARLDAAGEEERDRPASDFLEPGGRWNALLNAISTYANGAELELISVRDFAHYADDNVNWRVREGYGAMIAACGAALPVVLDCPVGDIDHSGTALKIETPCGMLNAKVAIVTLPTALLAREAIRFNPLLPEKLNAAAGLPLGLADKVVLSIDRPDEIPPESRVFGRTDRTGTGAYHLRPFGRPVIEGFFGGRLARELEQEGEGALARFAIKELVGQFGNGMRPRLRPLIATGWSKERYSQGSYSHALPGNAGLREILARPVDNRLFFAGEACSAESFSTAHGAYETGIAEAEAALAALGVDRKDVS
jgi:monoamine oxidase